MVGEANLHYVNRDYPKAIEILQEVIKIDPNIHSAWFTLGTIQDEMGCPEKALQLYLVAAHLTPHDGALWKRLGSLSKLVFFLFVIIIILKQIFYLLF